MVTLALTYLLGFRQIASLVTSYVLEVTPCKQLKHNKPINRGEICIRRAIMPLNEFTEL